jgi:hypothetical protein
MRTITPESAQSLKVLLITRFDGVIVFELTKWNIYLIEIINILYLSSRVTNVASVSNYNIMSANVN